MARLSTHVLDTANGKPAAGMRVRLYVCEPRGLAETVWTNANGRAEFAGDAVAAGVYELVFSVADYFAQFGNAAGDAPPFLGEVVVRFGVARAEANYHVPLLVSPFGYTTYRGS
jgi:5-hydroxyisourate hydrolase